jgi:hypothetical protein
MTSLYDLHQLLVSQPQAAQELHPDEIKLFQLLFFPFSPLKLTAGSQPLCHGQRDELITGSQPLGGVRSVV